MTSTKLLLSCTHTRAQCASEEQWNDTEKLIVCQEGEKKEREEREEKSREDRTEERPKHTKRITSLSLTHLMLSAPYWMKRALSATAQTNYPIRGPHHALTHKHTQIHRDKHCTHTNTSIRHTESGLSCGYEVSGTFLSPGKNDKINSSISSHPVPHLSHSFKGVVVLHCRTFLLNTIFTSYWIIYDVLCATKYIKDIFHLLLGV